jgi:YVTN family beta-propeller protein
VTIPPRPERALLLLPLLVAGCRRPDYPAYAPGFREFAYIANSASNTVTVLDLVYLRTDRTLRVGEHPSAVALNPVNAEVYVLNSQTGSATGTVSVIDTSNNQVTATIPVHRNPVALSVERTGRRAFVANSGSNTISVIDLAARRTVAHVATAGQPGSALIAPDGRTLVVTLPDSGSIALFAAGDPAKSDPPLTLRATFSGCPGATSPVILPDSSKAFVACPGSNQVMGLALAAAPNSWEARQDSSATADHALAKMDVGQTPTYLTLKPDGGEIFVSNTGSGSISEISTQTDEVGSTFGIGDRPAHGVISADNSSLWVSNSGADSVSLYSIDDGKRLPSIHIGSAPDALEFSADKAQQFLLVADRRSGDVAVIRTNTRQGPQLLTMLPAGASPAAIAVKSNEKAQ